MNRFCALDLLFRPVDARALALVRIALGLVFLVATLRFMAAGWVDRFFVEPRLFFPYYGFEWIRPGPRWIVWTAHILMAVAACGIAAGRAYRLSAWLFALLFTYYELVDLTNYLNHYYLMSLLAFGLALTPADRAWCWGVPSPPASAPAPAVPFWTLAAFRGQLALVYVFGGIAKLQHDWLFRAEPLATWLQAKADLPFIGPWLVRPETAFGMSWAGAAFDLTIPFLLLGRRTWPFACAGVTVFHLATAALFPIGMFPWIMLAACTCFIPTTVWHRAAPAPPPAPLRPVLPFARAVVPLALMLHFGIQISLPLRHWAFPGDVLWTDEGFRFSWRVMLVERAGSVDFEIVDPASGRRWSIDTRQYLTPRQEQMMAGQPDMVAWFARYLKRTWAQRGWPDVTVHAAAYAALNGRPARLQIREDIDLARTDPSPWRSRPWITR